MSRVFNKMYIVSGGVTREDLLSDYRFQTKKMLDQVPAHGYVTSLFDCAIEVDTTGMHIDYDTCYGDHYWTTWEKIKLKKLKCRQVAKINEKWEYVDIDPFSDKCDEYLQNKGYERKLDNYGTGWYDKDHRPDFKTAIFSRIYTSLKLEWDFIGNRYAGIWPNMKKDELAIYSGESRGCFDKQIGSITVSGKTVIIKLHDQEYRFSKETDSDFINFVKLCIDSTYVEREKRYPDANAKALREQVKKIDFECKSEDLAAVFEEYAEGQ